MKVLEGLLIVTYPDSGTVEPEPVRGCKADLSEIKIQRPIIDIRIESEFAVRK
jgi:hypothetical protein